MFLAISKVFRNYLVVQQHTPETRLDYQIIIFESADQKRKISF